MTAFDTHRAIEAIWRMESAKIIAALTRIMRDVGVAEELTQDALVAALEQWPESGVPDNPGAWLMTTAHRRAIDRIRRNERLEERHLLLGTELVTRESEMDDFERLIEQDVGDDLLRLMFIACHPVLPTEARIALTLRLLGGLTTAEIARAFLTSESTVAQRIVRAKRTLAAEKIPFELPPEDERVPRLSSVLEVLYLIFNEGYSATAGDDWIRPDLCHEALRLGRVVAGMMPKEPEVHGLVALLEIQASRLGARTGTDGEPVPLPEQNRALWDQVLIRRGLAALDHAQQLGGIFGPYTLQAALAACHVAARTPEETDWLRIAALYEVLSRVTPSPVVDVNRAVAYGKAFGPEAGLELVDGLAADPALGSFHLLPAVRADLLFQLGRTDEARAEFESAASLTRNVREQEALLRRAAECADGVPGPE